MTMSGEAPRRSAISSAIAQLAGLFSLWATFRRKSSSKRIINNVTIRLWGYGGLTHTKQSLGKPARFKRQDTAILVARSSHFSATLQSQQMYRLCLYVQRRTSYAMI